LPARHSSIPFGIGERTSKRGSTVVFLAVRLARPIGHSKELIHGQRRLAALFVLFALAIVMVGPGGTGMCDVVFRFARASPLEEGGFELSVPGGKQVGTGT